MTRPLIGIRDRTMTYIGKIIPEGNGTEPAQDRRGGARYVTVLKVGRAIVGNRDKLCLVRNCSTDGMKIDLPGDVKPDERVTIELRSDRIIHGTVRWSQDHSSGIEFDEPVKVEDILDKLPAHSVLRHRARLPRFARRERIDLEHESGTAPGVLTDISLHGLCIEGGPACRPGDRVVVHIPDLPPRSATVRWVSGGRMGLHFERPWPFNELALWIDSHD
jgi:PilZ domain